MILQRQLPTITETEDAGQNSSTLSANSGLIAHSLDFYKGEIEHVIDSFSEDLQDAVDSRNVSVKGIESAGKQYEPPDVTGEVQIQLHQDS
jgi:hypothetical protein